MEASIDKTTANRIKRLIYMKKQLDTVIDNEITDYTLRGRPSSVEEIREHLIYQMDDNLTALGQNR